MSQFTSRVIATVRRIPVGEVATYGDVAEAAGRPGAARAVGNIMRDCGRPDVPCHRVYGGNLELKRGLLRAEGIPVGISSIRNFSAHRARLSPSTRMNTRPTKKPRRRLTKHKARKLR